MSNIYPSIQEKLAALNIDIYHYEDIVRCYALAKLNGAQNRKSESQAKRLPKRRFTGTAREAIEYATVYQPVRIG